jgi:hypothetical protein
MPAFVVLNELFTISAFQSAGCNGSHFLALAKRLTNVRLATSNAPAIIVEGHNLLEMPDCWQGVECAKPRPAVRCII